MSPDELNLLGIAFVVGGPLFALVLFVTAIYYRRRAHAARSWPAAQGIVLSSRVRASSGNRGGVGYMPHIVYRYKVGVQVHENARLSLDFKTRTDEATAQAHANHYQVGQPVTVYYDPAQPDKSVIEHVTPAVWWLYLLAGMTFIMGVIGGAVFLMQARGSI
jgi:hypothetical protein